MSVRYSIEWIYTEFRIAIIQSEKCVESWTASYPVNNLEDLNQAMIDASHHVDLSRGGDIAIAYEDDMHTHEFVETPKLQKRDLEKYLQRRVDRYKPFEGDAAWCHHPVSRGTQKEGVLLHLMPKSIVDAVIRICEDYYMRARRLVPLTEIVSEHVKTYNAKASEVFLLITLFKTRVQMVISQGDGEILFVRELKHNWPNDSFKRFIVEINRTIGYSRQRIAPVLTRVYVLGEYAPQLVDEFKQMLNAPVELDESAMDANFWMVEVAKLSQRLSSNFIPKLARRAITRRALSRVAVLTALALSVSTVLTSASVQFLISKHGVDEGTLKSEILSINTKIANLNNRLTELESNQQRLNRLTADEFNLPAIFLSHLGNLVPEKITLTGVDVERTDNYWQVSLTGQSALLLSELPPVLSEFEKNMSDPPWLMTIRNSWQETWMKQLRSGGATQQSLTGFEIKGQLQ